MLVGKRGGRESCKQDDINEMMVRFAKAGKRVVRLKSGDPMIFGRAGEEISRLANEGIAVDVVPGITSASAMAAALGISLTHRDHAQSLRLVTGHSRHGDLPESLNWHDMADPSVTTIFYMGGRMAGRIAENLMAAGMASNTQAVAMTSISRAEQTSWRGTVGELADAVAILGVSNPILIGVGAAFAQPGTVMQCAFPEQAEQKMAVY